MLLCSYKERTKEVIDPKKLESGELKLSDLLTEEDFIMARSVSIVLSVVKLFLPHIQLLCVGLVLKFGFNYSCRLRKRIGLKQPRPPSKCYWTIPPRRQPHSLRRHRQSMMVWTPALYSSVIIFRFCFFVSLSLFEYSAPVLNFNFSITSRC